ncbi:MAG: DUF6714 family protein [Patescibacteria group bacterium]
MNNHTPKTLKLIKEIESAFENVKRENGITLHEAGSIDCYETKEKQREARKLDTDSRWQDVPDEWIRDYPQPWCFLDAKGERYYLPAYMRFSIKFPLSDSCKEMVLHIVPFSDSQGVEHEESIKSLAKNLNLNKNQCKAVFDFLKFQQQYEIDPKEPDYISALEKWEKLSK